MTKRAKKGRQPGFRMTQRDKEVVKAVYTHRALTTPQIEILLFPPDNGQVHGTKTSRARHRLKLLFHYGYLFRDEQPTKLSAGKKPLVYLLDRKAIPLLASEYGVFEEDIDWSPRNNKLAQRFLDHLLSMNDVRIAIEVGAGKQGIQLLHWLDEKTLKSREMKDSVEITGSEGQITKATIVPDGYFALTDGVYDYHNLLEIDMGTETGISDKFNRRTFARKIRGYLAYYDSGKYAKKYGATAMTVLTVTTGQARMSNLKKIAERLDGDEMFWFTTFDQVSPETVLTVPIWTVAGQKGFHPLVW